MKTNKKQIELTTSAVATKPKKNIKSKIVSSVISLLIGIIIGLVASLFIWWRL